MPRFSSPTAALVLILAALLPACDPNERLAQLSAPEVSCTQSDIQISDIYATKAAARYMATCSDGRTYRCISMGKPFGEEPETSCALKSDGDDTNAGEDDGAARAVAVSGPGRAAPRGVLPGSWPRVHIEACSAELTMPPNAKVSDAEEPTTRTAMHMAEASAGPSSFGFSCARLDGAADARSSADEIVAGSVRGAVDAIDGEVLQSRKLSRPPGRTLILRVKGAQMAMRIWLQGDWAYMANVVPIDKLPDGAVAEYFDRIQVEPPAP